MKNEQTYRYALILIFQALFVLNLSGQKMDSVDVWLDTNVVKTVQYAVANDNAALGNISLKPKSFPVAVIPEMAFKQMVKVNKERVFLSATTQSKIALLERQDALSILEANHLKDYIALQKQQIDLCNAANNQLNAAITSLNGQLDKAIQLSVANIKHERGKKIGLGVVAGLAGFALGIILTR